MKIVLLNAGVSVHDYGLATLNRVIGETLSELGMEMVETNLAFIQLPYYEGLRTAAMDNIVKSIESASALVVAAGVSPLGLGAPFAVFAEHLQYPEYRRCMNGKNCMVVLSYADGGARAAMNLYCSVLNGVGANDAIRVCVAKQPFGELRADIRAYVERQTEDFYRIVRANRGFLLPDEVHPGLKEGDCGAAVGRESFASGQYPDAQAQAQAAATNEQGVELYGKLDIANFREEQERDISEITQYFAGKLASLQGIEGLQPVSQPPKKPKEISQELENALTAPPRMRNCRQLTQSLTHHFQPHMAQGMEEVIQLQIGGNDGFLGNITIIGGVCTFRDGEAEAPDITILTDSDIWNQVVKGKMTAQKAFMVGQLKVRGNFVMLSKFEQLFNTKALS